LRGIFNLKLRCMGYFLSISIVSVSPSENMLLYPVAQKEGYFRVSQHPKKVISQE